MAQAKMDEGTIPETEGEKPVWVRAWEFNTRWPVLPVAVIVALVIMAIVAPFAAPFDYAETDLPARNAPPFWYSEYYAARPAEDVRILGADAFGRDIFSRLMHGARISLTVSAIAIVAGMLVGTALGLVAGYFGGMTDEFVSRFVDIWLALPFILIAMLAAIVFDTSLPVVLGLLTLLAWSVFVRNIRAETLSLKTRDYVSLARISGASNWRIVIRHILPGVVNTVIVIATLRVGQLILAEATLSYLGAGLPSPTPAWGLMVAEGREYLRTAWWSTFFPGFAIVLLVMALNFLGDWFRDKFDPRLGQL